MARSEIEKRTDRKRKGRGKKRTDRQTRGKGRNKQGRKREREIAESKKRKEAMFGVGASKTQKDREASRAFCCNLEKEKK